MRFLAFLTALALGACSFIGAEGPPETLPHEGPVECTKGRGLAFADMVGAILELGISGAIIADPDARNGTNSPIPPALAIAPIVLLGVIQGTSAIYGHTTVNACERANAEVAARSRSPISPTPASATSGLF